jgi:hypothetical protein
MILETHVDRILASWSRLGLAGEFRSRFEAIIIIRFKQDLCSFPIDLAL